MSPQAELTIPKRSSLACDFADCSGPTVVVESITVDKKIEFFFTLAPAEVYDGNHVVFGAVKSGQSVFDAIEQAHKNGETVQIAKCSLVEGQAIDKKSQ